MARCQWLCCPRINPTAAGRCAKRNLCEQPWCEADLRPDLLATGFYGDRILWRPDLVATGSYGDRILWRPDLVATGSYGDRILWDPVYASRLKGAQFGEPTKLWTRAIGALSGVPCQSTVREDCLKAKTGRQFDIAHG